jgi:cytidylate kinase
VTGHATIPHVVTISAAYGAGGSLIGPAVAERLRIPFVDRAIPATVAHDLAVPVDEALVHDQKLPGTFARALIRIANIPSFGSATVNAEADGDEIFRAGTEKVLHDIAEGNGGVILGRAAAIVLADHPGALHVRLHGAREGRIARVTTNRGLDPADVARRLDESDRARVAYVKHFYRADPADPAHYHLVLDTTAIPDAVSVDLITMAATARAFRQE